MEERRWQLPLPLLLLLGLLLLQAATAFRAPTLARSSRKSGRSVKRRLKPSDRSIDATMFISIDRHAHTVAPSRASWQAGRGRRRGEAVALFSGPHTRYLPSEGRIARSHWASGCVRTEALICVNTHTSSWMDTTYTGIVEQMGRVAKVQQDKEMVLWNG